MVYICRILSLDSCRCFCAGNDGGRRRRGDAGGDVGGGSGRGVCCQVADTVVVLTDTDGDAGGGVTVGVDVGGVLAVAYSVVVTIIMC